MQCIGVLRGHDKGISDVAWSPDGRCIASASDDHSICMWSAEERPETDGNLVERFPLFRLVGHTNYVFCVEWGPTGGILASGSFDETIRLWDVRGALADLSAGKGPVASPDRCLRVISAHADPVTGISFSPDGSLMASSSYENGWFENTENSVQKEVIDIAPLVATVFSSEITLTKFKHLKAYVY